MNVPCNSMYFNIAIFQFIEIFFHYFSISLPHNIVELLHVEFDLLETAVEMNFYHNGMKAMDFITNIVLLFESFLPLCLKKSFL